MKRIGIDVEVNGIIEQNRRLFSESENDILRRLLVGGRGDVLPERQRDRRFWTAPTSTAKSNGGKGAICSREASDDPPDPRSRARGLWAVEFNGVRTSAPNLKGAYRELLLAVSKASPDFLARFAQEGSRSRRFVARSPSELYTKTPRLADDHARLLTDGWYYDTNLSTAQVATRARVAARVSGMRYGTDFRILDNLREI